jgi:hypothetical protein
VTLSLLAALALQDASLSAHRARVRLTKPNQLAAQAAFLRAINEMENAK